jgi:hypothetical protein
LKPQGPTRSPRGNGVLWRIFGNRPWNEKSREDRISRLRRKRVNISLKVVAVYSPTPFIHWGISFLRITYNIHNTNL